MFVKSAIQTLYFFSHIISPVESSTLTTVPSAIDQFCTLFKFIINYFKQIVFVTVVPSSSVNIQDSVLVGILE